MEWHRIRNPDDPELDRLAERYHLHPLHVEDCRHRDQNAKVEENGYLFAVLKPLRLSPDGSLEFSDLDIFFGSGFLITVEEQDCPGVREVIDRVLAESGALRPDQVFYRLVDGVVDHYLPTLERFDERIDGLEDEVLERPGPDVLARIFDTKRDLILLRRVLSNTRDVAGHLQRSESALFPRDLWPFLRDVYDHVTRNLESVEMLRDLLSGTLDVYLSSLANRTNQVVKVLTVLGTVALPAIVVSGIFGMNLKGLPWSNSLYGALIVSGLMALSTAVLLAALRWFKWL